MPDGDLERSVQSGPFLSALHKHKHFLPAPKAPRGEYSGGSGAGLSRVEMSQLSK